MLAIAVLLPIALLIAPEPTFARIRNVVVTALGTWLLSTVLFVLLLHDPSSIFTLYFFFLIVVPALSVPAAAVLATRLAGAKGQLVSAVILGVIGWFAGVVVAVLIDELCVAALVPRYTWDYAEALAAPASYAALAALTACIGGRRTP
jgi:hypothetical protein